MCPAILDQRASGQRLTSGFDPVIHQEHTLVRSQRSPLNRQRRLVPPPIGARLPNGLRSWMDRAGLADRDEANAEVNGDRRAEDESPRLHCRDLRDVDRLKRSGKRLRCRNKKATLDEEAEDVGMPIDPSETDKKVVAEAHAARDRDFLRPARLALLDTVGLAPVVTRRHEYVDDDRTFRPDLDLVRDVAGNRPRVARTELAGLVPDAKHERAAETHPELLVLVLVLRNVTVVIELDYAECDPLAVDDAAVHAVPDPLDVERGEAGERAHDSTLSERCQRMKPHPSQE